MSQPAVAFVASWLALAAAAACHRVSEQGRADTATDADADGDTDGDGDTDTGLEPCGGGTFDVEPLEWALPELPSSYTSSDPFAGCLAASLQLMAVPWDFNLDGDIDLLVFSSAVDPAVGDEYWMLFQGGDGGFTGGLALWSLPTVPGVPEDFQPWSSPWDEPHSCSDYQQQHTPGLEDMDGDGLYDLVLADACDEGGVGTTHWLVYPSSGSGYPAEPVVWALPAAPEISGGICDEPFCMNYGVRGSCVQNPQQDFEQFLADMDGDARPDMVFLDLCDEGGVGGDRYEVHFNTGAGFEAEATAFPFPGDLAGDVDLESSGSERSLKDMDGDRRADIVITGGNEPVGLGVDFWLVWRNNGAGFDPAIEWTLPPTPMGGAVFDFSTLSIGCGNGGSYKFSLWWDMDLDGRFDLVNTEDCGVGGVGDDVWIVHLNTGSGFETAGAEWCLPPANPFQGAEDPFANSPSTCIPCDESFWGYRPLDMNDDGCLDLVVTDNCDVGGVGQTHWRVYLDPCEA